MENNKSLIMKSLILEYCTKMQGSSIQQNLQVSVGQPAKEKESEKPSTSSQRGNKQYSCTTCGKLFSTPGYLETHQRLHSGEKPYMCPICGRKFAQRPGYTYHMRTHSGDKRYQCRVCDKSFIQIGTIKRHCETHDLTNKKVDDLIIKLDDQEKPIPKPLGRMSKSRRTKEKRNKVEPVSASPSHVPHPAAAHHQLAVQTQLRNQFAQYQLLLRRAQAAAAMTRPPMFHDGLIRFYGLPAAAAPPPPPLFPPPVLPPNFQLFPKNKPQ